MCFDIHPKFVHLSARNLLFPIYILTILLTPLAYNLVDYDVSSTF